MKKEINKLLEFYIKKELESIENVYGKVKVKGALSVTRSRALWAIGLLLVSFLVGMIRVSVPAFVICAVILFAIMTYSMRTKGNANLYAIKKTAMENPDVPIEILIKDNMVEELELPKIKLVSAMWWTLTVVAAFVMLIFVGGGFKTTVKYEEKPDGYELVSYKQGFFDTANKFEIPSEYNGKPVVEIREGAFRYNRRLGKVVVPDTVTTMGSVVFDGCWKLKSVKLSENLATMGGACFRNCKSLVEIDLPDTLKELRGENFYNCKSLKRVKLPEYITEIKGNTFEYCKSLESIEIPEGVTRIAAHAFYGCSSLSEVKVPSTIHKIGSSAFRQCTSLDEIYIPRGTIVDERAFKESPTDIKFLETDYSEYYY